MYKSRGAYRPNQVAKKGPSAQGWLVCFISIQTFTTSEVVSNPWGELYVLARPGEHRRR